MYTNEMSKPILFDWGRSAIESEEEVTANLTDRTQFFNK